MCLIVFAWEAHPRYRLILAANRDEFHQRPAEDLHWWPEQPQLLAGRDIQAGGSWLAISRNGRFATVTNYREGQQKKAGLRSRGDLVTGFSAGADSPGDFATAIDGDQYAGFSLLAAAGDELWYLSNRGDGPRKLSAGIYGLSNASLDTPWSKLLRSRASLQSLIETDAIDEYRLMQILADQTLATTGELEQSGLPFEVARAVSAAFIVGPDYGTRCTTVLTWSYDDEVAVTERRFDAAGERSGETNYSFAIEPGNSAE